MKRRTSQSRPVRLAMEALEERRLMTAWGAIPKLIGQDLAVANYPTINGAGASIAILDSGINYNDPALGAGFGPGHKVVAGYDFVDNDTNPMDSDGHGTGLASIIAASPYTYNGATYQGVAPSSNLIALRVDDGNYTWNQEVPLVEQALQWVIANQATYNIVAVNMSFGKGHYTSPTMLDPIADEMATLNQMGVLLVASSGNDGAQSPYGIEYPAADPNVYAVGSVNANDVISTFTERSSDMDILAPGENVPLIYYLPQTHQRDILAGSGTSFSTAYIAGMAALLHQVDPSLTGTEMMSIMQQGGVSNFDGDNEALPYTGLTWKRLHINGAIARAYTVRDDAHENNDTTAAATTLSFSGDTATLNGLKLLKSDPDFYKFTLGGQADVDYALTLNNGGTSPSVDLLDSGGIVLKHLSANDSIRLAAGTYYIRIAAPSSTLPGTYQVSVTQTPDDPLDNHTKQTATPIPLNGSGQGSLSGMGLLGGVDDYYSYTVAATKDVNLSIDYGGGSPMPGGQLLDTNGNLIATFSNGALARRVTAGRYLIRVFSAQTIAGTYGVSVAAASVVAPGLNGTNNGIAYNASGALYMGYFDSVAQNLKFATRAANGTWSNITTVDGGLATGLYVSLKLDSTGHPGMAYYDANNADLKYAYFNGSAWSVSTVDATNTTGYYPSLAFDAQNRPVISYYYRTSSNLKFAAYASGAWQVATVDAAGDVGRSSSLALDPTTGRWAIAYEDTTHGQFKYAAQGKTAWGTVTVDAKTLRGGGNLSLAFNPVTKLPSFSYYDSYNADLKYASFGGSVWSTQTVSSSGITGLYTNLIFDSSGKADVLFFKKNANSVFRARLVKGVWGLSQVTTDGGELLSRAYDSSGETLAYVRGGGIAIVDL